MSTSRTTHKFYYCSFIVLLVQSKSMTFKGLYAYWPEQHTTEKIFGLGPQQLSENSVLCFYKYNSAAKEFREVHSKSFSAMTDAVSVEAQKMRQRPSLDGQPS